MLTDRERWLQALSIDPETGLDPPGHKVRAAQGLDAAVSPPSYLASFADNSVRIHSRWIFTNELRVWLISGYWVWQKVVENLAMLGYDTNSMDMAAYDW